MKFSYFNNQQHTSLINRVSRGVTGGAANWLPSLSTKLGKFLLMSPHGRREYQLTDLPATRSMRLFTSMGWVHVNLFGNGQQMVILSHGWADHSGSFTGIINALVNQGYCVAAIDHIGHGQSQGKQSNLMVFIEALDILLTRLADERAQVIGLVGHSMGAAAMLSLPEYHLKGKRLVLISTPVKFFEVMFERVSQAGISGKMLTLVLEALSRRGMHWRKIQQLILNNSNGENVTFIHDREDSYAPFNHLIDVMGESKSRLKTTSGLGHRKILRDNAVIDEVTQILSV